jgi:hypothetical protein
MSLRRVVNFFAGASAADLVMLALFIGWVAWWGLA